MPILTDRAIIALSGPEAASFLQGLVTNDVTKVVPGQPAYAALLAPQGKILFDFLIHAGEDRLLLDVRKGARDGLLKRLSMYKLRAKVELLTRDDLAVTTEGPADPRHAALGGRSVVTAGGAPGDEAYQTRRLELGIPEGEDFGSDRMFALDAGLDELHGVAFDKGCYIGQELTSRMKHRGTDRKRLIVVSSLDGATLPGHDIPITSGGIELGQIVSVYGSRGFALIRLDRLGEASVPLQAGGVAVALRKQDWLFT